MLGHPAAGRDPPVRSGPRHRPGSVVPVRHYVAQRVQHPGQRAPAAQQRHGPRHRRGARPTLSGGREQLPQLVRRGPLVGQGEQHAAPVSSRICPDTSRLVTLAWSRRISGPGSAASRAAFASSQLPASTATEPPHSALTLGAPRRVRAWSMTSSWWSEAMCTSSASATESTAASGSRSPNSVIRALSGGLVRVMSAILLSIERGPEVIPAPVPSSSSAITCW